MRRRSHRGYRKENLAVGEVYNSLVVIGDRVRGDNGIWYYPCMCLACGKPCFIRKGLLNEDGQKTCGCVKGNRKYPKTPRGSQHHGSGTRLYAIWCNMRDRTLNPSNRLFHHYGGRGISLDPVWDDYAAFRDWAVSNGYRDDLSIDRIDNDGPYTPLNCRWADNKTQANNRRTCHNFTHDGETKTLKEWSEDPRCEVSYAALYQRVIIKGKDFEKSLTTPRYVRFV